jgi:hypothetical protein
MVCCSEYSVLRSVLSRIVKIVYHYFSTVLLVWYIVLNMWHSSINMPDFSYFNFNYFIILLREKS